MGCPLQHWFSSRAVLLSRGQMAISGDIFDDHSITAGGGGHQLPVCRDQGCTKHSTKHKSAPPLPHQRIFWSRMSIWPQLGKPCCTGSFYNPPLKARERARGSRTACEGFHGWQAMQPECRRCPEVLFTSGSPTTCLESGDSEGKVGFLA